MWWNKFGWVVVLPLAVPVVWYVGVVVAGMGPKGNVLGWVTGVFLLVYGTAVGWTVLSKRKQRT